MKNEGFYKEKKENREGCAKCRTPFFQYLEM